MCDNFDYEIFDFVSIADWNALKSTQKLYDTYRIAKYNLDTFVINNNLVGKLKGNVHYYIIFDTVCDYHWILRSIGWIKFSVGWY